MKKFIYLSIALLSLSLVSCREQDEMAQILNDQNPKSVVSAPSATTNSVEYVNFSSANSVDGDPCRPPQQ